MFYITFDQTLELLNRQSYGRHGNSDDALKLKNSSVKMYTLIT
jgi:hypothetical protein